MTTACAAPTDSSRMDPDVAPYVLDRDLRRPRPDIAMDVTERTIPGPAGPIPVRVYRPTKAPAATVLFFHGGGWMSGSVRGYDYIVRKMAAETSLVFVSVDFRLSREHPFPAGLDDCTAAAEWVADHIEEFGGQPGLIAVAGDSSGGNLAAVVARRFRDTGRAMSAQLLLYPVIDSAGHYPSRDENGPEYIITMREIVGSAEVYLAGRDYLITTVDVAPMRAQDLRGLAPAVIGVAQFDTLRDEGLAYGLALRDAGVDVFARSYDGMVHTFAGLYAASPAADSALVELLAEFAQRARTLS